MWKWWHTNLVKPFVARAKAQFINWLVQGATTVFLYFLLAGANGLYRISWQEDNSAELAAGQTYKSRGFSAFRAKKPRLAHLNYREAAKIYRKLADVGDPNAQIELAKLSCLGWGMAKNRPYAEYHFRQSDLERATRLRLLSVPDLAECVPTT
ncbi:hypothetical protein [Methyloligella solikamskensis]|uniref:Uncharacterized protein n=1 Tax=Methyloligella solikamskensis TaxID=1177756 RepID=A0ABW3JDG9_9HYPH